MYKIKTHSELAQELFRGDAEECLTSTRVTETAGAQVDVVEGGDTLHLGGSDREIRRLRKDEMKQSKRGIQVEI